MIAVCVAQASPSLMMLLSLHSLNTEDLHISLVPSHTVFPSFYAFALPLHSASIASRKEVIFPEVGSRIRLSITECSNVASSDAAFYLEAFTTIHPTPRPSDLTQDIGRCIGCWLSLIHLTLQALQKSEHSSPSHSALKLI